MNNKKTTFHSHLIILGIELHLFFTIVTSTIFELLFMIEKTHLLPNIKIVL